MTIKNKLDKTFGPIGSTSGVVMLLIGIITTFTSVYGLFLVLIGSFIGFSSTSVFIDPDKRRIKFSDNIFGFVSLGKWQPLEPGMKIGIKESINTWTAYSLSNRSIDVNNKDFRLLLYDTECTEIMSIMKTDTLESALSERKSLCIKLKISEID